MPMEAHFKSGDSGDETRVNNAKPIENVSIPDGAKVVVAPSPLESPLHRLNNVQPGEWPEPNL